MYKLFIGVSFFILTLIPFYFSYWASNDTQLLKTEIELYEAQKDVMIQEYDKIIQSLENLIKTKNNSDFKAQKIAQEFWKSWTYFSSAAIEQLEAVQKYNIEKTEEYKIYLNLVKKEYTYNLTILNNLINKKSDLYYKDTGIKLNETEEEKALRKENEKKKNKIKTRYKNWKELFENKKYQDSLEIFKEVCPILSEYSYECNYMIWVSYYETVNYEESLKYLKKAQKEKTTVEVLDYIEKVNQIIDSRKKNFEEYQDNHKKTNLNSNKKTENLKKISPWVISNWEKLTKSEKEILQKKEDILKIINNFLLNLSPEQKKEFLKILIIELNKNLE